MVIDDLQAFALLITANAVPVVIGKLLGLDQLAEALVPLLVFPDRSACRPPRLRL